MNNVCVHRCKFLFFLLLVLVLLTVFAPVPPFAVLALLARRTTQTARGLLDSVLADSHGQMSVTFFICTIARLFAVRANASPLALFACSPFLFVLANAAPFTLFTPAPLSSVLAQFRLLLLAATFYAPGLLSLVLAPSKR